MITTLPSSPFGGDPPRRVAIFRALQLGDMLCAVPALRSLRAGLPQASVTLIGLPWACEFAQRYGHYIDEFLEFPGWQGLPERELDVEGASPFLERARTANFDLAVQLHGSGIITNEVVAALGARDTAGFYSPEAPPPVPGRWLAYLDEGQETERLMRLPLFLGCPDRGTELEFPVSVAERGEAAALLDEFGRERGGYAVVHPGGRSPSRRWPSMGICSPGGPTPAGGTGGRSCSRTDASTSFIRGTWPTFGRLESRATC